ncbi:hypothetical protein [Mycoplana rhizolycopersici]|uniref:Uncharacterized protein n=1 Tax=Mycoplana rhizolycopersici TaxID=2746702 RepID=A0ABX2QCL2_9HYPH|nr:hypothetical protein [Rhizobium rhizolycopersici]NVP54121.1 hypothetical protein [Rhizobium rhizolycopersici]
MERADESQVMSAVFLFPSMRFRIEGIPTFSETRVDFCLFFARKTRPLMVKRPQLAFILDNYQLLGAAFHANVNATAGA